MNLSNIDEVEKTLSQWLKDNQHKTVIDNVGIYDKKEAFRCCKVADGDDKTFKLNAKMYICFIVPKNKAKNVTFIKKEISKFLKANGLSIEAKDIAELWPSDDNDSSYPEEENQVWKDNSFFMTPYPSEEE